jgi:hypothetical protein
VVHTGGLVLVILSIDTLEHEHGISYLIRSDDLAETQELLFGFDGTIRFDQSQYYRSESFRSVVDLFLAGQDQLLLMKMLIEPLPDQINQKQ